MRKENSSNQKINTNQIFKDLKNLKFEEDYHRSPLQRLLHIFCFLLPPAGAFAGYFLSYPLWNLFRNENTPEIFKFIISLIGFFIPLTIVFVITRNTNPHMKIRVFESKENN